MIVYVYELFIGATIMNHQTADMEQNTMMMIYIYIYSPIIYHDDKQ